MLRRSGDGHGTHTAGTLVTASAHIITAVIGSGVLSLAWAIAQLGWVIGPVVLLAFSAITWFCSSLLADCYRAPPGPGQGKRNYTYGQAVRSYLGTYVRPLLLKLDDSTFKSIQMYLILVRGVQVPAVLAGAVRQPGGRHHRLHHHHGHQHGVRIVLVRSKCSHASMIHARVLTCWYVRGGAGAGRSSVPTASTAGATAPTARRPTPPT
jgi:hypothetical protein